MKVKRNGVTIETAPYLDGFLIRKSKDTRRIKIKMGMDTDLFKQFLEGVTG